MLIKKKKNKMKSIFIITIVCLMVLVPKNSHAQTDTLTVTFNEALTYATENAYMSKSAGYDIEAARKQVWEYMALGFPQMNLSGAMNDNLSIQENFITMEDEHGNKQVIKVKFGSNYSWNMGGHVDQLIFDGSYFLGVKASKIFVEM